MEGKKKAREMKRDKSVVKQCASSITGAPFSLPPQFSISRSPVLLTGVSQVGFTSLQGVPLNKHCSPNMESRMEAKKSQCRVRMNRGTNESMFILWQSPDITLDFIGNIETQKGAQGHEVQLCRSTISDKTCFPDGAPQHPTSFSVISNCQKVLFQH